MGSPPTPPQTHKDVPSVTLEVQSYLLTLYTKAGDHAIPGAAFLVSKLPFTYFSDDIPTSSVFRF